MMNGHYVMVRNWHRICHNCIHFSNTVNVTGFVASITLYCRKMRICHPIICAVDLIDGLVEGLGSNFVSLINGSVKFVLHSMAEHAVPCEQRGDRRDRAGLSQLLSEAISSIDPMHPAMCNIITFGEVS